MGTKRQGRTGLFSGASRTLRKRQTSGGSPSAASTLAGVTYAWDLASDLLTWGPNAAEALGLSSKDLPRTGLSFAQLVEPGSGPARREAIAAGGGAYDTRYALRFGPDRVVMVQDTGRWQPDAEGRPVFARGQMRPDPQASTPDLLPAVVKARSNLLLSIQNDINEALRFSHTCTLIAGSFEGGEGICLEAVGHSLRSMMRRHDHFTPLGSSRFALTLTCCPASEAMSAMQRLNGLLNAHPAAAILHLGAACAPDHTFQAAKLLRFAEQALNSGVERGDKVFLHKARTAAPSPASRPAPFDVVAALNGRQVILACRPMVDALTRAPALIQAQASLPGRDDRPVPLGPVPRLGETNAALLVDARMLELAADHLARHPGAHLALPIATATLQDSEWLPMLAAHLGIRPGIESRLMIEIPEAALTDGGTVLGRLDAMKALGIGLSLNGFGTAHVPPDRLQSLPIDLLKLDGVFIQPLRRSSDDRLYVRTLIDRAQRLGVATAAEWVDDEATARLLTSWGVDYLQGDLFGGFTAAAQPAMSRRTARARA